LNNEKGGFAGRIPDAPRIRWITILQPFDLTLKPSVRRKFEFEQVTVLRDLFLDVRGRSNALMPEVFNSVDESLIDLLGHGKSFLVSGRELSDT